MKKMLNDSNYILLQKQYIIMGFKTHSLCILKILRNAIIFINEDKIFNKIHLMSKYKFYVVYESGSVIII